MLTLALSLNVLLATAALPPNGSTAGTAGAQLYAAHCASCHGVQGFGGPNGPSLQRVGLASVDFYLSTGRMPAAVPWVQVGDRPQHTGERMPLEQIRAIEAYLTPLVAGGPAIPEVLANGDLDHGRTLFAQNCQQCHGVEGDGGDLGELDWAPSLHAVSINDVADAIRVGPGEMPPFGERQLTQTDLNDVASYVMRLQTARAPAALPFRSTGPVPEGAIGYLAIVVLVTFVFAFWRTETAPQRREEAVRRDEGEHST